LLALPDVGKVNIKLNRDQLRIIRVLYPSWKFNYLLGDYLATYQTMSFEGLSYQGQSNPRASTF
jgi:hypothetical protein